MRNPRQQPESLGIDLGLAVFSSMVGSEGHHALTFSDTDIAEVCGCSEKAIRVIRHHAMRKVRLRIRQIIEPDDLVALDSRCKSQHDYVPYAL